MPRIILALLTTFFLFSAPIALANPVSFKDGWGIMPTYTPDWSDLVINYSVTNKYSLGMSSYYRDGKHSSATFGVGQFNYLIKRWNEMDSQANIYGSLGFGGRHDSQEHESIAGYGAIEADYETRRLYTLFGAESLQSPAGVHFNRLRYRIGVAPYKAPIDALQTWLIAQIDWAPEMEDEITVTPMIRFFLNNFALELGASVDGKVFVAGMAHF